MRILIHSNAPWVPTGYGQQCAQLLPRLRDMGHQVAVSAFYGLSGAPIRWEGFTVYPAGQADYSPDVVVQHAQHMRADLLLTLMDFYRLAPAADGLARIRTAAWLPNDCRPLSKADEAVLRRSRAFPIAMSRFGLQNLIEAGFGDAGYVPHGIDTTVFTPPEDRAALREEIGVAGRFVIGICAANRDAIRKGFPEQFQAFAKFRKRHPEALLMLHSVDRSPGGYDLEQMVNDMGIADAVMLSDRYAQVAGHMVPQMMAAWYGALDVLSNCSYGEGFGIPIVEAQACGTPVVVTDAAAMTELRGSGWKVTGRDFWNAVHRAWWIRPDVDAIVRGYERAYRVTAGSEAFSAGFRDTTRKFALDYDAGEVARLCWQPLLKQLEES